MEKRLTSTFRDRYLNFHKIKSFPGQQEGELIEFFMRKHWVTLITLFLGSSLGALAIGSAFYIWIARFNHSLNLVDNLLVFGTLSTAFALLHHLFFVKLMNHFLTVTVVTNRRIIDMRCTTLLHRERDTLDLSKIQDMKITQAGIFQRLLDYGDITTHNATGQELFAFHYIPRPQKYFNAINHIHHKSMLEEQHETLPRNS